MGSHHRKFTPKGNTLYWLVRNWPGNQSAFGGLDTKVTAVERLGTADKPVAPKQDGGRLKLSVLPEKVSDPPAAFSKSSVIVRP